MSRVTAGAAGVPLGLLALAAFLRVYEAEFGSDEAALWAKGVREGMSGEATARFESSPDLDSLFERLEATAATTSEQAGAIASGVIKDLLQSVRPACVLRS